MPFTSMCFGDYITQLATSDVDKLNERLPEVHHALAGMSARIAASSRVNAFFSASKVCGDIDTPVFPSFPLNPVNVVDGRSHHALR